MGDSYTGADDPSSFDTGGRDTSGDGGGDSTDSSSTDTSSSDTSSEAYTGGGTDSTDTSATDTTTTDTTSTDTSAADTAPGTDSTPSADGAPADSTTTAPADVTAPADTAPADAIGTAAPDPLAAVREDIFAPGADVGLRSEAISPAGAAGTVADTSPQIRSDITAPAADIGLRGQFPDVGAARSAAIAPASGIGGGGAAPIGGPAPIGDIFEVSGGDILAQQQDPTSSLSFPGRTWTENLTPAERAAAAGQVPPTAGASAGSTLSPENQQRAAAIGEIDPLAGQQFTELGTSDVPLEDMVAAAVPRPAPQADVPLSRATNNPGSLNMGGTPTSIPQQWGAVDWFTGSRNPQTGEENRTAIFPDPLSGAAAQFQLLDSPTYVGKTFDSALNDWSARGYSPASKQALYDRLGVTGDTRLTSDFVSGPSGIELAKTMADLESQGAREIKMLAPGSAALSGEQWQQAQDMAYGRNRGDAAMLDPANRAQAALGTGSVLPSEGASSGTMLPSNVTPGGGLGDALPPAGPNLDVPGPSVPSTLGPAPTVTPGGGLGDLGFPAGPSLDKPGPAAPGELGPAPASTVTPGTAFGDTKSPGSVNLDEPGAPIPGDLGSPPDVWNLPPAVTFRAPAAPTTDTSDPWNLEQTVPFRAPMVGQPAGPAPGEPGFATQFEPNVTQPFQQPTVQQIQQAFDPAADPLGAAARFVAPAPSAPADAADPWNLEPIVPFRAAQSQSPAPATDPWNLESAVPFRAPSQFQPLTGPAPGEPGFGTQFQPNVTQPFKQPTLDEIQRVFDPQFGPPAPPASPAVPGTTPAAPEVVPRTETPPETTKTPPDTTDTPETPAEPAAPRTQPAPAAPLVASTDASERPGDPRSRGRQGDQLPPAPMVMRAMMGTAPPAVKQAAGQLSPAQQMAVTQYTFGLINQYRQLLGPGAENTPQWQQQVLPQIQQQTQAYVMQLTGQPLAAA